jgi:hypothetical protein
MPTPKSKLRFRIISPSPSVHHLNRVIARRPANPVLRLKRAMRLPFS